MASLPYCFIVVLCLHNLLFQISSAAVHSHSHNDNNDLERESDGSYRSRDSSHYNEGEHNSEFDHEAILGSVKEADEFDKLSPEESKKRLANLLLKMDVNGDQVIERSELKLWILDSFTKLSREEAEERLKDADDNEDGVVSWSEYLQDAFGVDSDDEVGVEDTGETGMLLHEEKAMWVAADSNNDGHLSIVEFEVFSNPEEHPTMHPFILNQTLREKDKNKDGIIDFQEYLGDKGPHNDKQWVISEKEKFDHDLDLNMDGVLDNNEIEQWVLPNNDDIAEEEVNHLFASADDDHDDELSFDEILEHHDVFVGSEATSYGQDLEGRFDDEL